MDTEIQHCILASSHSWDTRYRTPCRDACVLLQKLPGILQHPAVLVSSGQKPVSSGCIRLHITTQSPCTMVHRSYCPGFPLSVICLAPITLDNAKELAVHEQEQIQKPERKRRTTDLLPESLRHREKVCPAQCSTALSKDLTRSCRHHEPPSCEVCHLARSP